MKKKPVFKELLCTVTKANDNSNKFRFVASADTPDRGGDIIEVDGWKIDNYLNNPVILWGHDHGQPPIGKGEVFLDIPGKRMMVDVEFADDKTYPFAGVISKLVDKGFIKGVSVGFMPMEYDEVEEEMLPEHLKDSWFPPIRYKKQELIEISVVSVPMHQDALRVLNSFEARLLESKNFALLQKKSPGKGRHDDEDEPHDPMMDDDEDDEDEEDEKAALSTTVQTLIFDKEKFTVEEAKKWLSEHDYSFEKVDEKEDSLRFRQKDPLEFDQNSFKTIDIAEGVQAVIGKLKKVLQRSIESLEKNMGVFILELKTFVAELKSSFSDNSKAIVELSSVVKNLASLAEFMPNDLSASGKLPVEDMTESYLKQIQSEIEQVSKSLVIK